jgi:hypothetical protein
MQTFVLFAYYEDSSHRLRGVNQSVFNMIFEYCKFIFASREI